MQSTELHDSRVEQARMVAIQQLFCQMVEILLAGRGIERQIAVEQAREHTIDIAVKCGIRCIESKRCDGTGRIITNARQSTEGFKSGRETGMIISHVRLIHYHLGGLVEIACTGVVAEALPETKHLILIGGSEQIDCREGLNEAMVVIHTLSDTRLLKDDLGQPNIVRISGLPPRQYTVANCVPIIE